MNSDFIYLREMEWTDWKAVHQYASMGDVCRYQPWGPNSEEETRAYVNQVLVDRRRTPRTRFVFAIIQKESNELVGAGELNLREKESREGEIGYVIHPKVWRNGFGTEAARLLLNFGFNKLQCRRIVATCDPRNVGSCRILEKIGMTQEGRLRDHILFRGGWRDSLLYSVLHFDWSKPELA